MPSHSTSEIGTAMTLTRAERIARIEQLCDARDRNLTFFGRPDSQHLWQIAIDQDLARLCENCEGAGCFACESPDEY